VNHAAAALGVFDPARCPAGLRNGLAGGRGPRRRPVEHAAHAAPHVAFGNWVVVFPSAVRALLAGFLLGPAPRLTALGVAFTWPLGAWMVRRASPWSRS